ncbi:beta family protein [Seleniivibrio woodruffii]|uniref:T4 beta protein n=1 Tax=Seleniivibrio woodruffii TaxID=1078050 RepID=A0A4R1K307_9BACT|nr:hypothetical protein [Seleniivibrio woodruffii]TCK58435.1 T4 beta protein [Seleniivibrio woodruffii]TVZ36808.1 T4 beta protein [Seleniivibrio woodruffii]
MKLYMPILKNRTIELSVLKELIEVKLCNNIFPMLEIIQEKTRSNSKTTYIEELKELLENHNNYVFVDFPKLTLSKSIADPVKDFLTSVNRDNNFVLEQYKLCSDIKNIIPVISFNQKESPSEKDIKDYMRPLLQNYQRIAFRLSPQQYSSCESFLGLYINNNFLLLDIDDKGHTNPAFKKIFKSIKELKKTYSFYSIILNSNRSAQFYNKNIEDGEPIEEIDNSLKEVFNATSYSFDGFGDYACVSRDLPTSGGAISPAGVFYSKESNFFVGFKGRLAALSEFKNYIAPAIVKSEYWLEFDKVHQKKCPGCKKILDIYNGKKTGMNQGMWKGITMGHYIYTISEEFCEE